jgi:hypothetical protein
MRKPRHKIGVRGLHCPQCGSPVALLAGAHTRTVACSSCGAILDCWSEELAILEKQERLLATPSIRLGKKGQFFGIQFQLVGFLRKSVTFEGEQFSWNEYLLFNPYRGFRWLTQEGRHWNFVETVPRVPERTDRKSITFDGKSFRYFQSATSQVEMVLGEFYWEVRTGDTVTSKDYICPPYLVSSEQNADELSYSLGQYFSEDDVFKAFGLKGTGVSDSTVAPNQPNPWRDRSRKTLSSFVVSAAVCLLFYLGAVLTGSKKNIATVDMNIEEGIANKTAVSSPFLVKGLRSQLLSMEVHFPMQAAMDNSVAKLTNDLPTFLPGDWITLKFMLLDSKGKIVATFFRDFSFKYFVAHSTFEKKADEIVAHIRTDEISPGEYKLATHIVDGPSTLKNLQIKVVQGGTEFKWVFWAFLLLPLPFIFTLIATSHFETKRWSNSSEDGNF